MLKELRIAVISAGMVITFFLVTGARTELPGQYGDLDDLASDMNHVFVRLDGANSERATGTHDYSNTTLMTFNATVTEASAEMHHAEFPPISSGYRARFQAIAESGSSQETNKFLYNIDENPTLSYTDYDTGLEERLDYFFTENIDAASQAGRLALSSYMGDIVLRRTTP